MGLLPLPVVAISAAAAAIGSVEKAPSERACVQIGNVQATFSGTLTASSFRTRDGKEVRLAGVIGPGEDGGKSSPQEAERARATLASFVTGHSLSLAVAGAPDRYQRIVAEVFADDVWVQDAMLRRGLLRVAPEDLAGNCIPQMLSAENQAITTSAGHWGDGMYRIRTPDEVTRSLARFEVVEGEIWRTRLDRGKEVIEFNNASSFRVELLPQAVKALRDSGTDFRRLRGRVVRVHGWLNLNDQPLMEISAPEAVQIRPKPSRPR